MEYSKFCIIFIKIYQWKLNWSFKLKIMLFNKKKYRIKNLTKLVRRMD